MKHNYILPTLALGAVIIAGQPVLCATLASSEPTPTKQYQNAPSQEEQVYQQAEAERVAGKYDAAIADYNRVLQMNPKNAFALGSRGAAKLMKGDAQGAIEDLTASLNINDKDAFTWTFRGLAYVATNQPQAAISDATKAIGLDPKMELAYFIKGRSEYATKDYTAAIDDLKEAINLHPEYARNWFYAACSLQCMNKMDDAKVAWQKCVELAPNNPDAHYNLAIVLRTLGDKQNAIAELQVAAKQYQELNQQQYAQDALAMIQQLQQAA
ncbi:MAG TPA: tetratricopeptide repeat protein [Planktothrix sp.]|jgi:tetratricopeptide (TPR) repeat protein